MRGRGGEHWERVLNPGGPKALSAQGKKGGAAVGWVWVQLGMDESTFRWDVAGVQRFAKERGS